jgi:hypothetical protein
MAYALVHDEERMFDFTTEDTKSTKFKNIVQPACAKSETGALLGKWRQR